MRGLSLLFFVILASCSREQSGELGQSAIAKANSCLSSWASSQYSYFSGKKSYLANLTVNKCALKELSLLEKRMSKGGFLDLASLERNWGGTRETIEKALQVKTWLVGGENLRLTRSELKEIILILKKWQFFLKKTQTNLPIAQRNRGDGGRVYFEQAYRDIEEQFLIFLENVPGLLEPFDIDHLFSLFSKNKEEMGLHSRKDYFLSLIILENRQASEINVSKTFKTIFQAIELEQNFRYIFTVSWFEVLSRPKELYYWLKKPKKYLQNIINRNGYLPYDAFEKMGRFVNQEIYGGRFSIKTQLAFFKVMVQRFLSTNHGVLHDGIGSSQWEELVHLYEQWFWLEQENPEKNIYNENFISLMAQAVNENYGSGDKKGLNKNQFAQVFNDFYPWLGNIGFLKNNKMTDKLFFFDGDMLSSVGNGDLRLSSAELSENTLAFLAAQHNNSKDLANNHLVKNLFRKFDQNNDLEILKSESSDLFNFFKKYIQEDLGHKGLWWRSRWAYFYLIEWGYWPSKGFSPYPIFFYSGFSKKISIEWMSEIITNSRQQIRESSSYHSDLTE